MSSSRRDFRLTKIICTIGPATGTSETMARLARAGMNVARLNMSHGDHESHGQVIRQIKNLNKKLNHPIAILMDLQGPEIRTGELPESLNMNVGDIFTFTVTPATDAEEHTVHVNYRDMARDLSPGDKITVDNGLINLEVLSIEEGRLKCRVLEGGQLGSRKHINLPGVRVNLPSITEKDKKDIRFAVENDLDFVALSFARRAEDVLEARQIIEDLDGHAQIIAKIENQEGVENFREILNVADGVMIARGDLGVEIDIEELPIVQRQMVQACVLAGKPVIVATHLLESMIENPMPTRAEATDVANAIYEQADCVMLSGETATGKYPVKCVQMLDRIARRMEKEPGIGFAAHRVPLDTREELARSAVKLADSIHAPAILVITRRGIFARQVASFRPRNSIIYAFTNMSSTRRKLWTVRAVVPFLMDFSSDPEKTIQSALEKLRQRNRVMPGDPVVIVSDVAAGKERVTSIQVRAFG
ncbi:MAG: pyruvate kinase [Spirochaetaceae bacterium]|nr:pyruvate kinase [Spirochaetaceae bacterium]|tara:strand:- start:21197 stop:22621 length:1425 start_codon:yes stop_codon:yes gene_type:complete